MTLILKRNALTSPEPHPNVSCRNHDDQAVKTVDIQRVAALHTSGSTRVYIPPATFVVGQQIPESQQIPVGRTQAMQPARPQALPAHSLSRGYTPRDRPEYPEGHPRTWTVCSFFLHSVTFVYYAVE